MANSSLTKAKKSKISEYLYNQLNKIILNV